MLPGRESIPRFGPRDSFTFAVFGDNQIYEFDPGPRFRAVVAAVARARPGFAVHVGDAIYSETNDRDILMRKWDSYREALRPLPCPLVQTLGNHDGFDTPSLGLWRELWGETRFHFDAGCARFIALDAETVQARLDEAQFSWLAGLLEGAGERHVFIFVHRPLFSVVGHIGDSLDVDTAFRDRLHALFARHAGRIGGVFHGHEHVFCHQEIDGVDYYHCAGSGSNLYAMPQQGGFYHFLLATVSPAGVRMELRKVGTPAEPRARPRRIGAGVLENWASGLTWVTWDSSVAIHPRRGGMELDFNLGLNKGPYLGAQAFQPRDLGGAAAVALDITVPPGAPRGLRVTPSIHAGKKRDFTGKPVPLRRGRNTVRLSLKGAPLKTRARTDTVSWTFSAASPRPGPVRLALSSLRAEGPEGAPLREEWASGLNWYAWNNEVAARGAESGGGIALRFDLARCRQPHIYTEPRPALDLSAVSTLILDVLAPAGTGGKISVSLAVDGERRCRSPWQAIPPGKSSCRFNLGESWLDKAVRRRAVRLEIAVKSADHALAGEVVLNSISAE